MLFYVCIGCLSNDWLDLIVQHFSLCVACPQCRRVAAAQTWKHAEPCGCGQSCSVTRSFTCGNTGFTSSLLLWPKPSETAGLDCRGWNVFVREGEKTGWRRRLAGLWGHALRWFHFAFLQVFHSFGFSRAGQLKQKNLSSFLQAWTLYSGLVFAFKSSDCLIRIQSVPFREHGIVLESCTERLILQQNMNGSVCSLYSHAGWS